MVRFVLNDFNSDLVRETTGGTDMNTLTLPTNNATMTDDQYEALQIYVAAAGTPLEKAMLYQIKAVIAGSEAWHRARDIEWDMRLEAETDLREVRLAMRKAHALLSATNSKTAKPKLLDAVQQALDELDVFEVAEGEAE